MKWKMMLTMGLSVAFGISLALAFTRPGEISECKGVGFEIEDACLNPEKLPLNDNHATLDLSVRNSGIAINGFVITVDGKEHKLFRTVQEGDTQVIQIPYEGDSGKVEMKPLVISQRQVYYCSSNDKEKVKPCANAP